MGRQACVLAHRYCRTPLGQLLLTLLPLGYVLLHRLAPLTACSVAATPSTTHWAERRCDCMAASSMSADHADLSSIKLASFVTASTGIQVSAFCQLLALGLGACKCHVHVSWHNICMLLHVESVLTGLLPTGLQPYSQKMHLPCCTW